VQKQIIVLSVLHSSNSRVARSVLGKSPQNKHNVVIVLLLAAAIIAIAYATELHTQLAQSLHAVCIEAPIVTACSGSW
jgi:hypothetical protein